MAACLSAMRAAFRHARLQCRRTPRRYPSALRWNLNGFPQNSQARSIQPSRDPPAVLQVLEQKRAVREPEFRWGFTENAAAQVSHVIRILGVARGLTHSAGGAGGSDLDASRQATEQNIPAPRAISLGLARNPRPQDGIAHVR